MTNQDLIKRLNQGAGLQRTGAVMRDAIDLEARTVEVAFSSETEQVERWFGIEVLGHDEGQVDLSRLNSGAPVLWMHNDRDQRGVVESAWIGADKIGRAKLRFSKSDAGEQLFQDILGGIVTKAAVGYQVGSMDPAGERDGVDVYRATRWCPYEISMMSYLGKDDVGVGRSAEIAQGEMLSRSAHTGGSHNNSVKGTAATMNNLQSLFVAARQAKGDIPIFDGHGNVSHVHRQTPAAVARYSLRTLEVPTVAPGGNRPAHLPLGKTAGKRTKFSEALLLQSQCAIAGTQVILVPEQTDAIPNSAGIVAFQRQETSFDVIEPAMFSRVFDGDEVGESALTIHSAWVDEDIPTYGFRVPLSRAEQKSYADGRLADITLVSIAAGVTRLADEVVMSAILARSPVPFSLGAAAALGLDFDELRAIVGTSGLGAAAGADGTLRAAGLPAALTPVTTATIAGAFNRSAIAIHENIALIAERTSLHGGLTLTCWVNMQAMLPVPGAFWKVDA